MRASIIIKGTDKEKVIEYLEKYAPIIGIKIKTFAMTTYNEATLAAWKEYARADVGILMLPESMQLLVKP